MALMTPNFLPSQSYPFGPGAGKTGLRYVFEQLGIQEGVMGAADFKVSQRAAGGAAMFVDIAAGGAWVKGDDTARQGYYHAVNDAVMTIAVPANASGLPRFDQAILRNYDSSIAGGTDGLALEVIIGTPDGSATIDNRVGAAALPPGALRLGEWVTPNGAGMVSNAMIRDRRPRAERGVLLAEVDLTAQAASTLTSTSYTLVPGTDGVRYECGERHAVRAELWGAAFNDTAARGVIFAMPGGALAQPVSSSQGPTRYDSAIASQVFGGKLVEWQASSPVAGTHAGRADWKCAQAGHTSTFRGGGQNYSALRVYNG